eukprot:354917-Chlamydomonas_euryale.AAC.14
MQEPSRPPLASDEAGHCNRHARVLHGIHWVTRTALGVLQTHPRTPPNHNHCKERHQPGLGLINSTPRLLIAPQESTSTNYGHWPSTPEPAASNCRCSCGQTPCHLPPCRPPGLRGKSRVGVLGWCRWGWAEGGTGGDGVVNGAILAAHVDGPLGVAREKRLGAHARGMPGARGKGMAGG